MKPFNAIFLEHWRSFEEKLLKSQVPGANVDGVSLDIASVLAVSRYEGSARIDERLYAGVTASADAVQVRLNSGKAVYGVNTGFGGSAFSSKQAVNEIQRILIRQLHYGILVDNSDTNLNDENEVEAPILGKLRSRSLPLDDPVIATSMPESWVRAAMLTRLNSLIRGASGVRPVVVESLLKILNANVVPRIPLRGSISASGDLSPLSYIGGVLQGKSAIQAYVGSGRGNKTQQRRLVTAKEALEEIGLAPVEIMAKEGLSLVNGTAMSAAVGALALHEVMCQTILSQIITTMSVEALCGSVESFDDFFGEVRPHTGQVECAKNIKSFLAGSQLAAHNDGSSETSLRQDRYSTRTASQWVAPVIEDITLAHQQITVELNSVTDNPIIDKEGNMLHGGNFQAKSVTSAMEKCRQACQTIGQMLFAQCTELINPATSRGLPPNLVVDEPNQSWLWKGTDIFVAALQSELGFLSNSAGSHVQFAEMGNQALNSLALISARYTLTAADVLTQLSAAHIVALCQAFDLRAVHLRFLSALQPEFQRITRQAFGPLNGAIKPSEDVEKAISCLWGEFVDGLARQSQLDSSERFEAVTNAIQAGVLREITNCSAANPGLVITATQAWSEGLIKAATKSYTSSRKAYIAAPDATPLLGLASRKIYTYVRQNIGVPFLDEALYREMESEVAPGDSEAKTSSDGRPLRFGSMGAMISAVYNSMRNGSLYAVIAECLGEVEVTPNQVIKTWAKL